MNRGDRFPYTPSRKSETLAPREIRVSNTVHLRGTSGNLVEYGALKTGKLGLVLVRTIRTRWTGRRHRALGGLKGIEDRQFYIMS